MYVGTSVCSLAFISSIYYAHGETLEVAMNFAEPACFCWIPLRCSSSCFPSPWSRCLLHAAVQSCLSQGNSWRGDGCHALTARCVRMAASVSATEWDAASYKLNFLWCAGLAWSLAEDKPLLSHSWEFGERFRRAFLRGVTEAIMTQ